MDYNQSEFNALKAQKDELTVQQALREMDARDREYDWTCKLLQQAREENKRLEEKYHVDMNNYRSQVQTWQQQHDSEIVALRTELSAKDEVLEWYADAGNWDRKFQPNGFGVYRMNVENDVGEQARSILSQYAEEEKK